MAEYWKSAPRFWCKQCKIFIRDTPFEKTQHEASPKHQGSLKRFLRDIHRNNEQQQRESQRAKSEVERLRQAVSSEPSKDDPNASAAPWKKRAAPVSDAASRPVSLEERKKQMEQLAEMGVAIPDEYRGEMALAGEWQTMSETKVDEAETGVKSIGVRKRKLQGKDDEDSEEEFTNESARLVSRGWGSRMRSYPGTQNEGDGDLDALLASTQDLKKTKVSNTDADSDGVKKDQPEATTSQATKEETARDSKLNETDNPSTVKTEASEDPSPNLDEPKTPEEAAGPIFKKRKAKIMRKQTAEQSDKQ
ncbi:hypothetical protein N7539_001243 [Penicillium diatomitis]|uniref:U1-type domain-containing protein n=1 Tax=Penicillium diatomitis TaxID=2819901 RepID=A0A9W9XN90_9EURO|nr:uncharacterized protein N7539_001243 [Penicillium diatomitis]KAJ5496127.1 hypothetical protein N7539_001243 [Penicillium diatomitis]